MKVIIDRSKWLRGEGEDASYLLRKKDGKMCCLGFCALAAGYTPEQILGKRTIDELIKDEGDDKSLPHQLRFLVSGIPSNFGGIRFFASKVGEKLMTDNDDEVEDDDWREEAVSKKLRQFGIEAEFVDNAGTMYVLPW